MHGIRTLTKAELVRLGIQAAILGLVATERAIGRELQRRAEEGEAAVDEWFQEQAA